MIAESVLKDAASLFDEHVSLKRELIQIELAMRERQRIVVGKILGALFPYMLEVYSDWRPKVGEVAMVIDFEDERYHEIRIKEVDGYDVLANPLQQMHVNFRFELNPSLERYECARFALPKSAFDELKPYFSLMPRWS